MIHLLREELREYSHFLKRKYSETVIIPSATLLLVLNQYNPIGREWVSEFL